MGFHIYNSRCIDRKEFRAFFNLWNHGGPNCKHEFKNFLDEEVASWQKVRGKKSLSFADIFKLPLTGANAIPIRSNVKFSGGHERQARAIISVFNRMGSPSHNLALVRSDRRLPAGGLHQTCLRISAFNRLGLPSSSSRRRAVSPWFSSSDPIGKVHGGGIHDRSKFQNLNFNRSRPRNLHWRLVSARGPVGLLGPSAFRCHFCKERGHLELFCPSKKSSFGFPLASFPAFGSRAILVGNRKSLDHSPWFRSPVVSLTGGPPSYSCFEEFAWEVLKKSESSPLQSLTLSLGVTSSKPQTARSLSAGWRSSLPAPMAYRRVDLEPFLPLGFSASVVLHREVMARSVTRRLSPLHEDWAIINIQPLPDHEVTFPAVRDVVREY
jgi:hypothetical protein